MLQQVNNLTKENIMNNLLVALKFESKRLEKLMSETFTDKTQFSKNIECEYKLNIYESHIKMIEEHFSFIGVKVYKYEKSFKYSRILKSEMLNKTEKNPTLFTKVSYECFQESLSDFVVERFTEQLTTNTITPNSTSQMENAIESIILVCKQDIISLYREFTSRKHRL